MYCEIVKKVKNYYLTNFNIFSKHKTYLICFEIAEERIHQMREVLLIRQSLKIQRINGDTYNMHWSGQFNRSSWILNFGDKTTSTASPETRYRPIIAYWPEPTKMRTRPSSYDTREPTYKDETEDMYRSGKWTG